MIEKTKRPTALRENSRPHPPNGRHNTTVPPLPSSPDAVPVELQRLAQWVAWKYVPQNNGEKPRKIPVNAKTGGPASVSDPTTWTDFATAYNAAKRKGWGVGFVFTPTDPYAGVDLDNCLDRDGHFTDSRLEWWVRKIASYTEVSPSGTGVKIFLQGQVPRAVKTQGVEVYSQGRFFTVTGKTYPGQPRVVEERQEVLDELVQEVYSWAPSPPTTNNNTQNSGGVVDVIPEGQRNNTLASIAGKFRALGWPEEIIAKQLQHINATQCRPPLPEAEVIGIAHSVSRYPAGGGGVGTVGANEFRLTDLGNANRFVSQHINRVRYCHELGGWFTWDSSRWVRNDGAIWQLARETVNSIWREAESVGRQEEKEALIKHALRTESRGRLEAMVGLASGDPGVRLTPDELDKNPYMLNVKNGVLDLMTGTLHPHDPSAPPITMLAGVEYDPMAQCPRFEALVERITGKDAEKIALLQRLAGYALTGDISEQVWFYLYGVGGNGKTLFTSTLRQVLGDYATEAPEGLVTVNRGDRHPTELAALRGKRLVIASEPPTGGRLNDARLKMFTGGERITARTLWRDFFTFAPTFKLVLMANHYLDLRDTTESTWRRVVFIHFPAQLTREEVIKNQWDRLAELEGPGILTWAYTGLLAVRDGGIAPPAGVQQELEAYRKDLDLVERYLAERCWLLPEGKELASKVYGDFRAWCEANGELPLPNRHFIHQLTTKGLSRGKGHGGFYYWTGLTLRSGGGE